MSQDQNQSNSVASAERKNQAFFLSSGGREIFAQISEPMGAVQLREGVVICAPAPHEIKKTHWTIRQLAQRLQQAGYTTLRFDYYGTGDSAGSSTAFDLAACQENIADAISYLKNSGMVRRITVVALRLSCPLTLEVLQRERVKRLVFVDPVLDGESYLSKMQKMHAEFVEGDPTEVPFAAHKEGRRQLLGYPFDLLLDQQLRSIIPASPVIKAKSLHIIQSASMASLEGWAKKMASMGLDDVQVKIVGDQLRWDSWKALFFQDFPNDLISAVVEAVRAPL